MGDLVAHGYLLQAIRADGEHDPAAGHREEVIGPMRLTAIVCRTWLGAFLGALAAVRSAPAPKSPPASLHGDLVNLRARNVPVDFSVEEGKEKRLLWKAQLGKVSYAGP